MATQAEDASTKDDPSPWEEFKDWHRTLRTPPWFTLADRDIVTDTMAAKLCAEFRIAVAWEQWHAVPATAPADDGAPAGWDSDTLLAEMVASDRAG